MKKYFLVLFLFCTHLLSGEITIKDSDSSYKDFQLNLYQDKSKKLSLKEIQNIKDFQKTTNNVSLGKQEGNIWLHFSIKNLTNEKQQRVLFITEPTLWDIELFIISDKKTISSQNVGQNIFAKDGKIAGAYPELEITLEAREKVDIYIRNASPFHHTFQVQINTIKDVVEYKILKNSLLFFYFGTIVALLLYNLFIFFSIKDKNYLLYVGFAFFYLLAQIQHNIPINSLFSSLYITFLIGSSHIFWVAFHTLFSVKLLNIKEYYPRLDKYLSYIVYFLLAVGFFGIYDLPVAIQIVHVFVVILPFVLLFTAISMHIKKNKLAIFYIIAQTLFLTSSLVFGLLFAGVLEHNNFTRYIHLIGSFSEIILFSFALGYKTRLIMKENEKNKEMLNDYSKLTYMGETVVNVYHQWKSPVNNIYNYITHIETAKEFKDKNIDKIVDTNLEKIKQNTQYLRETASEFLKMNTVKNSTKEEIILNDEINSVLKLMDVEFKKNNIKINGNYNKNIIINTHKNQLRNLFMILIENAIKTFKNRDIKNPELKIDIVDDEKNVTIVFEDNGGGIIEKPINKIFERYQSASDSSGLGLYLAKHVLIKNLGGEISVENIDGGARFTINLTGSVQNTVSDR
jgi:signal transduction histidine kinase